MRSRSAAFEAKVITGCISGGSVVSVMRPSAFAGMPRKVVGGQAVQLSGRGLDGLRALLNVAAEFERELRSLIVQALQAVARGLVLVHAGQPVAEQRALDVVLCGRADWRISLAQIDSRKSLVDGPIQAQSAGGLRHPLRFQLRLVAHRLFGGHGVQYACLRAGQAELLDGLIVEAQRVFRRALRPQRPAARPTPPHTPSGALRPRRKAPLRNRLRPPPRREGLAMRQLRQDSRAAWWANS
jgi:hypothetical protein